MITSFLWKFDLIFIIVTLCNGLAPLVSGFPLANRLVRAFRTPNIWGFLSFKIWHVSYKSVLQILIRLCVDWLRLIRHFIRSYWIGVHVGQNFFRVRTDKILHENFFWSASYGILHDKNFRISGVTSNFISNQSIKSEFWKLNNPLNSMFWQNFLKNGKYSLFDAQMATNEKIKHLKLTIKSSPKKAEIYISYNFSTKTF